MIEEPTLDTANAVLRVARDAKYLNSDDTLSQSVVSLSDLRAEPRNDDSSKKRSFSVVMFCNQEVDVLKNIARQLAKEESFKNYPRGAAAKIACIKDVLHEGNPAFEMQSEGSTLGHPGHVGITFSQNVRQCEKAVQRELRDRLLRCFSKVRPIEELHKECCQDMSIKGC